MEIAMEQRRRDPKVDKVIQLKEASLRAGLSVDVLKRRSKEGNLKFLQLSANRLGVRESELDRFLRTLEVS